MIMSVPQSICLMVVILAMAAMVMVGRIGTAFRLEWRFDFDNLGAEASRHVGDDVIAPDAKRPPQQLRRQVPIAQMPGQAREMVSVVATDFQQSFARGDDLDQAAVLENERVTTAQPGAADRKVKQKLYSALSDHRHAAPLAFIVIEHDAVSRIAGPNRCWHDRSRAHCGRPRP
jgi:hypothetical protein